MKKTMIVFDFDNTLFKTKEFWRGYLFPRYEALGLSRDLLEDAFKEATQKKADYFVEEYFLSSLSDRVPHVSYEELARVFRDAVYHQDTRDWYHDGAVALLKRAKATGLPMHLVTYGDVAFKQEWFKHCGIYDHFDPAEVTITNRKKTELVPRWANMHIVFINDVLKETEEVVRAAADNNVGIVAHWFNVRGESAKPSESAVETHISLGSITF